VNQLQQEKIAHGITKNQLESYPEEKSQLLKQINTLKSQIESLENENHLLTQNVEHNNLMKSQTMSELNKIQTSGDPEKLNLQTQLEKQKNGQLELTIENCQLKARIDNTQKLLNNLSQELTNLRSGSEKEKSTITQLETENSHFKENWSKHEESLANEKIAKTALVREIDEIKKQMKSITDLTSKAELLEKKIKEEQSKRHQLESRYTELLNQFEEIAPRTKPESSSNVQATLSLEIPELDSHPITQEGNHPEQTVVVEYLNDNPI
jgi:chromosome segregation ATPase